MLKHDHLTSTSLCSFLR